MDRHLAIGLVIATPLLIAAESPTTVPEIAALLPSGIYSGHAIQAGKRLDLSLNIQGSKPNGRFTGTIHLQQAPVPCGAPYPITGDIKPAGTIHIESRTGVTKGCERTLVLKLAGNDLNGTLMASE